MTEEQRRESLRKRREKIEQKEQKKNYKRKKKRSSITEDNENQHQATLKRLSEVMKVSWRQMSLYLCTTSLYLCTASQYLCTTSLYLCTASQCLCTASLFLEKVVRDGRRKKSKTGEDGSNHTAHVGPGDGGRKKSKKE